MSAKKCVLDENKFCDDCGECDYCDLNPFKICDNCGKCIGLNEEYRELKIDEIQVGKNSKKATKCSHSDASHSHNEDCDCGHCH